MGIDFERTMSEYDFKRALLQPNEERLAKELQPEPDLKVDGLKNSLMSRLLGLFSGSRRR